MTDTTYIDKQGTVNAAWLNDVNNFTYRNQNISGRAAMINVKAAPYNATGDGVTDDGSAIQAAITALDATGGGTLLFPPGTYLYATTLVFKNNIVYFGAGNKTLLKYTGASDAVQVNNPINSSTSANYAVRSLRIQCTANNTKKACFADVGSSYIYFDEVTFIGNQFGLILDQSELCEVSRCIFTQQTIAGSWCVNGADHTVSAAAGYTNRIEYSNCQFNESSTCVGIANDGGNAKVVHSCNFNGCSTQVRISGERNIIIEGSELEGCSVHAIYFSSTTLYGTSLPAGRSGIVKGNLFTGSSSATAPHNSILDFDPSSLIALEYSANSFVLDSGGANPDTDPPAYVNTVVAFCNANEGTGVAPYNNTGTFTGTLTGCTTSPTVTCQYTIGLGRQVTLFVPSVSATSNSTAMTLTGMPARLQPTTGGKYFYANVQDSGANATGECSVTASDTITFYKGVTRGATTFTNSGTKGINGTVISYSLA